LGATAADTVFVTREGITGVSVPFTVLYGATGGSFVGIRFLGGSGADTIVVQSTLAGGPTTVNSGGGGGSLVVPFTSTLASGLLTGLAGPLTVDGGGGSNSLLVSEAGTKAGDTVALSGMTITTGSVPLPITYLATGGSFAAGIQLFTGSGNDVVRVL